MISESIDFNHPLKQACLDEIEDTCDGIPHGDARVIRCLQDGDRKKFSRKCTKVRPVAPRVIALWPLPSGARRLAALSCSPQVAGGCRRRSRCC